MSGNAASIQRTPAQVLAHTHVYIYFHCHSVLASSRLKRQPNPNPNPNLNLNPCVGAGATAIACWLEDSIQKNTVKIYAACAGDSQAIVFNTLSGGIPSRKCRLWDDEMQV
jgi:hypothetical protein